MGEHHVENGSDPSKLRAFVGALLNDLRALEQMLGGGRFETGVRRIGAEQEMFLVDRHMSPAFCAPEVIARVADPRVTTEIALFNLEANLTPRPFTSDCFRRMEEEIAEVILLVRDAARAQGVEVLLAGILPTVTKSDLSLESITPDPRYRTLNDAVMRLRGGRIHVHIKGVDEVNVASDNIMPLSSNTSFQVHVQAAPDEFVTLYNATQAVTAPVLAASVNSPLWLGNNLWQETRIALFQHSADARSAAQQARGFPTRVGFGDRWLEGSVLEIFREDIARFRVILTADSEEDALEVLAHDGVPRLKALGLHNGTVWWWNRACYGVTEGVPHLRIENRVIPSGPTPADEVANAAFFSGLTLGLAREYGDVGRRLTFHDAKANFINAARLGLGARFNWFGGKTYDADSLIVNELLPLAREGLKAEGVDASDAERYLGTVEERVRSGQTGARWTLKSWAALGQKGTRDMRLRALAEAMFLREQSGEPVHRWAPMRREAPADWRESYRTVGQFMSTDLFTVRPDDLVDLAASVMHWRHVRHVPVEDDEGRLVGLLSHRNLLRLLSGRGTGPLKETVTVREIMKADPLTVTPQTPTLEAIDLMRAHSVGCLPVVEDGALVGIVTAHDFLAASARLFEERLREQTNGSAAAGM